MQTEFWQRAAPLGVEAQTVDIFPQLDSSDVRSTQPVDVLVRPLAHVVLQLPLTQVLVAPVAVGLHAGL